MTSLHSWMISLPIDFGTFISRKLSLLPKTSRKALIYMSHTMASFLIFCPFFSSSQLKNKENDKDVHIKPYKIHHIIL